uniref:alpha/beta hydrolase n=1 Tax=Macrococcoides caseolyticum TaxID=69966 RepID=UPI0030EF0CFD
IFMLKIKAPQTVYFQGNDHAVLLLHSFTGTTRDMKLIGDALAEADFSYMIPAYPGHGQPIETFIQHSIMDWWKIVEEAYLQLLAQGFQKISIIGVSLGGLFTLKLVEQFNFHQAIIMSTPMHKEAVNLEERLKHYAENTQKIFSENELSENNINNLIKNYYGTPLFIQMIDEIMTHLSDIQTPVELKKK